MQKITFISMLIILFLGINLKSQTTLQSNENLLWVNSFENAKTIATKKKFAILLFFTGSDTCSNCIKMRQNILDSKEFIEYSSTNFVMFHVDYPASKKNKLSPAKLKKIKN
jgi:thioredoxin-related protein